MQQLSHADIDALCHTLVQRGAVVIPALTPQFLAQAHDLFEQTLLAFPEYRRDPADPALVPGLGDSPPEPIRYVRGGFGALGNPASFHNPFVRQLRWHLHEHVAPLFSAMHHAGEARLTHQHQVHVIPDRMRVLTADASISAETWHRDTTPAQYTLDDDIIFGGWVNLDPVRPQRLSALLGSHRVPPIAGLPAQGGEGFAKFDTAQQTRLTEYRDGLAAEDREVIIPPGALLLFYQELIHEVVPRKAVGVRALAQNPALAEPEFRLFTAWRLTRAATALVPTLPANYFSHMALPHLKSDQEVAMYPTLYYVAGTGDTVLWAWSHRTFPAALLTHHDRKGRTVLPRIMPSLAVVCQRLGLVFPPYPAYNVDEQAIYHPHVQFRTIHHRQVNVPLGGDYAGTQDDPIVIDRRIWQ